MDMAMSEKFYKEADPKKRIKMIDQVIESGEDKVANAIRKEILDARYKKMPGDGTIADGYLKLWMELEFNRNTSHKLFGKGRAKKEILKYLEEVRFTEFDNKDEQYKELLYKECEHLIRLYLALCEKDRNYNTVLCGLISIKKDSALTKMQADIYETAIKLPKDFGLEKELATLSKAARAVYKEYFPDEEELED